MEELDDLLLEQLHVTKKTMKVLKRFKKIFPHNKELFEAEEANKLRQKFFEDMIENKDILKKKKSKHKHKSEDILDKNPLYYVYRNTIMVAAFGYMYFSSSMQNYWKQFRKDKNEKSNNKKFRKLG